MMTSFPVIKRFTLVTCYQKQMHVRQVRVGIAKYSHNFHSNLERIQTWPTAVFRVGDSLRPVGTYCHMSKSVLGTTSSNSLIISGTLA